MACGAAWKGELGGHLLALFLRESLAVAALKVLDEHLIVEHRTAVLVLALADEPELYVHAVLLTPLYELRLEVYLLVSNLVDVDELAENLSLHEPHAGIVAMVEI